MDLETENRIAAMLLKEAADLRRQAEKDGVLAYLRQPTVRGRPNSRFLTATVLGVQQANRVAEVNEMWKLREKEIELDRPEGKSRNESRNLGSQSDSSDSRRKTNKRRIDVDLTAGASSSSRKKRSQDYHISDDEGLKDDEVEVDITAGASSSSRKKRSQDYHIGDDQGLKDDEVEEFLHSRSIYLSEHTFWTLFTVKRGRGAIGSRMDETGPYLPSTPDSIEDRLVTADMGPRVERERRVVFGPEKPVSLKGYISSEDESLSSDRQKEKVSSSKHHSRKHKTKKKSKDKRRKRKEEKRHKDYK